VLDFLWLASLSFVAALSGAVVPGPVFVIVVSESLKRGKTVGPLVVLGHLAIEAFMMSTVFLGLDVLLRSSQVTVLIGYLGGVTLVLMGSYLIRAAKNFRADTVSNSKAKFASHGLVAAGFLSSSSNPQFFLWWLTIGVSMIAHCVSVAGAAGFVAFFFGHAAADLLWFGFISYSVDKGRAFLNQKVVQTMLLGSAIFLIIFGLHLIFSVQGS